MLRSTIVCFSLSLFVAACSATGAGKQSGDAAADTRTAEIYVYPNVRHVSEPDYSLTGAEKQAALRVARQHDGEIVFEIVVDRTGEVGKIRSVHTTLDDRFVVRHFQHQLSKISFGPGPEGYRTFYYVLNIDSRVDPL